MIARDFQPFSIIQDTGFRDFVNKLNPRYKIISRKKLTEKLLPEYFGVAVNTLNDMLKKVSYVAITTDAWTSAARDAYLGITCHFIGETASCFNLVSAALDAVPILEDETAESLKTILSAVFEEWGITDKVKCIVTDNAAAMIKAAQLLKIRHLPCFAHTLNLVIKNAVKCKAVSSSSGVVKFEALDDENDDLT